MSDQAQRQRALCPQTSFIVQAPAGSGKTQLLITRFMHLLLTVTQAEAILCVTFTKKACGELRDRMREAINLYQQAEPDAPHRQALWRLSQDLQQHAQANGWCRQTLANKLSITTMDSAFQHFLRQAPNPHAAWSDYTLTMFPDALYQEALQRFFQHMQSDKSMQRAYCQLLDYYDHRQAHIESLLLRLLATREMWLAYLMPAKSSQFVSTMQQNLVDLQTTYAMALRQKLQNISMQSLFARIHDLAACYDDADLAICHRAKEALPLDHTGAWHDFARIKALGTWLLTQDGGFKKRLTIREGLIAASSLKSLPKDIATAIAAMQHEIKTILNTLCQDQALAADWHALCQIPIVPSAEHEWQTLKPLTILLPVLVAHLHALMQEKKLCDFAAIGLATDAALVDAQASPPLALRLHQRYQHLLIDEFQDTSQSQFRIFERVLEHWSEDIRRSVFIVGDPMQAIYRFRQGDVTLFQHVIDHGLAGIKPEHVVLTHNYRSHHALVDWHNRVFQAAPGNDFFHPSTAQSSQAGRIYQIRARNAAHEAETIVQTLKHWQRSAPNDRVCLLIRSRSALAFILPALQHANIAYHAEGLDDLSQSQLGYDMIALSQLHHLHNQKAWLSVLRSPAVGLDWHSLYLLSQSTLPTLWQTLHSPPEALNQDARARIAWLLPILSRHIDQVARHGLILACQTTWVDLGWPELTSSNEHDACHAFWHLAYEFEIMHQTPSENDLIPMLQHVTIAPAITPKSVTILTIHKSKGLEFDRVVVCSVHKKSPADPKDMLTFLHVKTSKKHLFWLHTYPKTQSAMSDMLIYMREKQKQEAKDESLRVLYVALTRAKKELVISYVDTDKAPSTWLRALQAPLQDLDAIANDMPVLKQPAFSDHDVDRLHVKPVPADQEACEKSATQHAPVHIRKPLNALKTPIKISLMDMQQPTATLIESDASQLGTLLHRAMEFLHHQGFNHPQALNAYINQIANTMPFARIDYAKQQLDNIKKALASLASCSVASWIFDAKHSDIHAEYALWDAENRISVRIDRTFFDPKTSIRWIIDFKSYSQPNPNRLDQHQHQLRCYAQILKRMHPNDIIRCGLYFPLSHSWQVIPIDAFSTQETTACSD